MGWQNDALFKDDNESTHIKYQLFCVCYRFLDYGKEWGNSTVR